MPHLASCLWFNGDAEEAAEFYVSLFPNSRVTSVSRYSDDPSGMAPFPGGTAIVVEFELDGRAFQALNGGPQFPPSEAYSTMVLCEDQAEVDHYWDGFIGAGGTESQCGWLKDAWGVSWQIVPKGLAELLADDTDGRSQRALQAMLGMKRLVIADLEAAADRR